MSLATLLATFDASTPSITVSQLADRVRMINPPVEGVAALLVIAGTMVLDVEGEGRRLVPAGELALVPAGLRACIAGSEAPSTVELDGRRCLALRDGWLVADATRG